MHSGLNTNSSTFTALQMEQTSPSNNEFRTHAQGSTFIEPPTQAHATTCIISPVSYSVNHVNSTHRPTRNTQITSSLSTGNQHITVNHLPAVFNRKTFCNFLGQLQGNFMDDGRDGGWLQVLIAGNGDKQHGIVRRVCSSGEDRLIYDENSRFTLCSKDDDIEAVMLKRVNIAQSLRWWTNDGKAMVWRRLHEAKDELTLSRVSREFSEQELSSDGVCNRPEVPTPDEGSPNDLINLSVSKETSIENSATDKKLSDNELFGIFRTYCEDTLILKEILDWGITRRPNLKVGEKEIRELASGRLWVNVRLS